MPIETAQIPETAAPHETAKQQTVLADISRRRDVMAVLVEAGAAEILARLAEVDVPEHDLVRPPETGLVMVQGRTGGDGPAFNVGEATVTRAAVRLSTGEMGFACVLGRDADKARLVALCDAMVQTAAAADDVARAVVAPLRARLAEVRAGEDARTAATRVDFFTLVRGED